MRQFGLNSSLSPMQCNNPTMNDSRLNPNYANELHDTLFLKLFFGNVSNFYGF